MASSHPNERLVRGLRGPGVAFALLAALAGAPAGAQPLPAPVADAVRAAALAPHAVGVVVVPLDGRAPAVAHNADASFNPASTMKLVTTYAALSLLGADYRWSTSILMRGRLAGDVLVGDVVLRGGGDPKLVVEDMTELVARLRASGLREIRGDLVIDDSLYELSDEGTLDGDPSQPYNVRPHAALMNFKATKLVVRPRGDAVSIELDPPLADVPVVNEVKVVKGPCRFGAPSLAVRDAGPEDRPSIRVGGAYSAACGEQATMAAVLNHRQFIHGFFAAAWRASGGTWAGRTTVERRVEPSLPELARWTSPRTLADVVRDINKFSNNVMARQVMLQTSVEPAAERRPATLERARRAVLGWLERRGLRAPELVIDNGSGLSRQERISPASLARLLVDASRSEQNAVFVDSLPVVGVDGTMKHRLASDPVAGRAWIKTGSLNGVRSIAGYVDAASGRRWAVVMFVNGPRAEGSGAAQDALIRWVHQAL